MTAARRAPRGPAGLWVASLVAGTLTSRRHTRLRWLTAGPAARSGPPRGRSRQLPLARTSVRHNAGRGSRAAFVGGSGGAGCGAKRWNRCLGAGAARAAPPTSLLAHLDHDHARDADGYCGGLGLLCVGADATARHLLAARILPTSLEPRHAAPTRTPKRITPRRYRLRDVARRSHPPTNRRERHPPRAPPARSATSFHR